LSHWAERYVGRQYVEGMFDCADMARLVQKEVFGRDVAIPGSRDYADKIGIGRLRAMEEQIAREIDNVVTRTESPREGDGVLLIGRGYAEHIGIYCVIGGEPYVLHAANNYRQVVLSQVRNLEILHGLKVEGYYRWM
jgi:hypothetical protein